MAKIVIQLDTNFATTTSLKEQIAKVDTIIDSLLNVALVAVQKGDTVSYSMNDGQIQTSRTYSSPQSISKALEGWYALRDMLSMRISRSCGGGVVSLVDIKTIYNGKLY